MLAGPAGGNDDADSGFGFRPSRPLSPRAVERDTTAMAVYQAYYLDERHKRSSPTIIEAPDHATAIAEVWSWNGWECRFRVIELSHDDRIIYRRERFREAGPRQR